jgi:hypothetical protein
VPPRGATLLAGTAVCVVVTACGLLPPGDLDRLAERVDAAYSGTRTTWTVSPWPFAVTTAFLCTRAPAALDPAMPDNPDPGACSPLDVTPGNGRVEVSFDPLVDPQGALRIGRSGPPWFLVLGGQRGETSASVVREIIDSPVPSDPGPS